MKQRKEKGGSREIFCKMQATEEEEGEEQWPNLFALLPAAPAFQERTPTRAAVCWLAHQMDDQGKGM